MGKINWRQGIDKDVYQIVRKLEDDTESGRPKLSISGVYEAIKRSNSSLSRQKKRPLEDSIERVLQFRKDESHENSDDEDELLEAQANKSSTNDVRFTLNKQMAKSWGMTAPTPKSAPGPSTTTVETNGAKKRKLTSDPEPEPQTDNMIPAPTRSSTAVTEASESAKTVVTTTVSRKAGRSSGFEVEHVVSAPRLGGVKELLESLIEDADFLLRRPAHYDDIQRRRIHGIIISGPSGTGKRSLIRAVAAAVNRPIVYLRNCFDDPERLERRLGDALDEAKRLAPCIVLIEGIHQYMFKATGSSSTEGHGRVISEFRNFMKRLATDLSNDSPVLAMGTTTKIADIDQAVLGLGMMEKVVKMQLPDMKAREEMLRALTWNWPFTEEYDYQALAKSTHGFVPEDLVQVLTLAGHKSDHRILLREREIAKIQTTSAISSTTPIHDNPDLNAWLAYRDQHADTKPKTLEPVTFQDISSTIASYIPLTRKEGFSTIPNTTWSQVGALDTVRDTLKFSIIDPIRNPAGYADFGIGKSAGVLLWGPPGCGKTLVARAMANDAQASFIAVKGPELLNKYVGESERAVRDLFSRAVSSAPCILFFDEMDSLVPRREGSTTDAGTRVVNALLAELDGTGERNGVYVVGTTNRPDMIDPAILRPGRLDVKLFLDLPTEAERVDILNAIVRTNLVNCKEKDLARLEAVAKDERCKNFSGADLQGLYRKAAETTLKRALAKQSKTEEITDQDWQIALSKSKPSVRDPDMYRALEDRIG